MSIETNHDTERGASTASIQARLAGLRRDFEVGSAQLRELTQQEAQLRDTMLRIGGAIQVLEELLAGNPESDDEGQTLQVP